MLTSYKVAAVFDLTTAEMVTLSPVALQGHRQAQHPHHHSLRGTRFNGVVLPASRKSRYGTVFRVLILVRVNPP